MSFQSQQRSSAQRELLEEFIRLYRREPCLWQITNRDYYNRSKRNDALDRLLKKYREAEPTAVRDDVARKINSLRTTYKKEKRKVDEARLAGSVRVPKLWCYSLLAFIDGKRGPAAGAGADGAPASDDERAEMDDEDEVDETDLKHEYEEADGNEVTIESTRLSVHHSDNEDPISTIKTPGTRKRKVEYDSSNDLQSEDGPSKHWRSDTLHFLHEPPKRYRDEGQEDRHDIFSKYITRKLRDLPKQQGLLAEKLINEVLFEAEWGNLTLEHKITK